MLLVIFGKGANAIIAEEFIFVKHFRKDTTKPLRVYKGQNSSFCNTKMSSVPIKAIVVGPLNPDAISVIDKVGSCGVGTARAREERKSQANNPNGNCFR